MILQCTFLSEALNATTGITIATPSGLPEKGEYRVAYLLHGYTGGTHSWASFSRLPYHAREGTDTIYVMPDGGNSFYTDMKHGPKYFTYITEELPRVIQGMFRVSKRREDTAIMGLSMGGYGALKCALAKPEQYGFCGAFSSACLYMREVLETPERPGRALPELYYVFGENLEWSPEHELLELAKGAAKSPEKPVIYMTCGTEDEFHADNLRFKEEMKALPFEFSFEDWKGGHDFIFFDESAERAIRKFCL